MSYGDDMWALGLLVGELVTGRLTVHRITRLLPVSLNDNLLLEIVADVEGVLGGGSQLFDMFACLLHKDPALRLSARQLHIWLDSDARPAGVARNEELTARLRVWRELRAVRAPAAVSGGSVAAGEREVASGDGDTDAELLACLKTVRLEKFAGKLVEQGFETLEDLSSGFEFDDSFLLSLGMGPGHIQRFRKMLSEIAAE